MRFARWVFAIAGIYGVIVIAPLYFLEARIGADDPPAVTHPEYYYGFVGITLAWQIAFFLIARQPQRYRPMMLASIVEKAAYGLAVVALYASHRVSGAVAGFGCFDLLLGVSFMAAFVMTPPFAEQAAR
jgi:hypothetical protein